jgi:antitoxin MazE
MQTRVQKWGNSLALRIPKAFVDEISIAPNAPVNISVVEGKLIITPVIEPELTLDDLLAGITDENLHHEIDAGPAVGNEVW